MKTATSAISTRPLQVSRCLILLLVAVALAVAPQQAHAGKQVPFRAAFTTEFESNMGYPISHIIPVIVVESEGSFIWHDPSLGVQ